jgi:uncharacterized SAM-binding protein YcdF (DUF218 family)
MTDFSRLFQSIPEPRKLRGVLRSFSIVLLLALAGLSAWLGRESLLRGAADLWIVSDPVTQGDAVVVLGGGLKVRPFVAADLYRKGLVGKVLISQVAEERRVPVDLIAGDTELNREVLIRLGVPDTAIETFGTANRNTADEAFTLREWTERKNVSVLIIPTEIFSARRVRWSFRHEFVGTGVRIEVPSFEARNYTRSEWWKTEDGMIAFQNEIIKYMYYRLRY